MIAATRQIELACSAADRGRFDEAVHLCRQVIATRPELASACALLASIYRQAGRHDLALPYDEQGLAAGAPDPLGAAMCALGLTADRIGTGNLPAARANWSAAQRPVDSVGPELGPAHWARGWFDPGLTRAWVGAELGLLADDPAAAVTLLRPYQVRRREPHHARWHFEQAKTLLFLGVAQRCCGLLEDAADSLSQAVRVSAWQGLAPLLVPALGQLRALDGEKAGRWDADLERARCVLERHHPPLA